MVCPIITEMGKLVVSDPMTKNVLLIVNKDPILLQFKSVGGLPLKSMRARSRTACYDSSDSGLADPECVN